MGKKKRTPKKTSRVRKFFSRLGITLLVLFIIGGIGGMGTFAYLYATTDLPDPNADFQTDTSFIYYDDGATELGTLMVQNRVSLDYEEMPETMKQAVVAAENRTFWTDPGFSVSGILRSLYSIATGGELQGGSTITQQYIKILYLDSSRQVSRKVRELVLATKMGRELPKEEILEGYLNTIYFGRGAYGIQAAAQAFFAKDAKDMTLQESAALAAILNNPSMFAPTEENLPRLLERYQYVLDGMLELEYITQAEHDAAYTALPEFPEIPQSDRYGGPQGFLMAMVESELAANGFDESQIRGGGLRITTTINKTMNDAAIATAQEYTAKAAESARQPQDPSQLHIAISTVDTATGGLKAMYGGADYVANQRNWATTPRPTASTFKTFATIAALENGFSLKSTFNGDSFTPRGEGVPINNAGGAQYGVVTLEKSVTNSINTAFVDLETQMTDGPAKTADAANRAGAPTHESWQLTSRLPLGLAEVSTVNMANAYATLANDGKRNDVHIVAKVTDRDGKVLYEAASANEQAINSNVAANVTEALTNVVDEGTATRASTLDRPVAGKTGSHGVEDGTTQAAWFIGYTKQLSTAVMYVAGDTGTGDLDPFSPRSSSSFYGGGYPLQTWVDYMSVATEGMEVLEFSEAKSIKATTGNTMTPAPRAPSPEPSESPESSPSEAAPSPTPSESAPVQTPPATDPATTPPTTTPTANPTPPTESGVPLPEEGEDQGAGGTGG